MLFRMDNGLLIVQSDLTVVELHFGQQAHAPFAQLPLISPIRLLTVECSALADTTLNCRCRPSSRSIRNELPFEIVDDHGIARCRLSTIRSMAIPTRRSTGLISSLDQPWTASASTLNPCPPLERGHLVSTHAG